MHKLDLEILTKDGAVIYNCRHEAPSQWKEMSKKHLMLWASVMCSTLDLKLAKSILSFLFYGIPSRLTRHIPKSRCIVLLQSIGFLFNRNGLDKWLIPKFWHGLQLYYGPKDKLSNITVEEFKYCEYCYEKFDETKDLAYLNTLCAILYRPRRWFGIKDDIRSEFTINGYEKRTRRFEKLKPVLTWAIYLNYEGCRNFIIRKNKDVFESSPSTGGRSIKITPWAKIIENAANGAFGHYEQTEKANAHKFLSKLGQQIKDFKESEHNKTK